MTRKKNSRAAQGAGNIRKKTVVKNGLPYTYWEARVTIGRDPGTGKQLRRSFSGKTQKEVREKMQAAAVAINDGDYFEPSKLTVGQWLDTWAAEYLNSVKPRTVESYKANIKQHIKPAIGALRLSELTAVDVQRLYNGLTNKRSGEPLSAKSKKNVHGTLHKALEKAVALGYIRHNPADKPDLPKIQKAEIKPLADEEMADFLNAINGTEYESVYLVTLFTGMREGEVLGLTWDCIDFESGTITIKQQLQKVRGSGGDYVLVSTKNGKTRIISPASYVMQVLTGQRKAQNMQRLRAGSLWSNPQNLVFTNSLGKNLCAQTVYLRFKKLAADAGVPSARFHDLRHSYAVAALRSGDDIKTVQENLGHHTAAFTLDTYAHVTEQMRRESARRMDNFIEGIQAAKNAK